MATVRPELLAVTELSIVTPRSSLAPGRCSTDSTAKNTPEMGALKPAATPAQNTPLQLSQSLLPHTQLHAGRSHLLYLVASSRHLQQTLQGRRAAVWLSQMRLRVWPWQCVRKHAHRCQESSAPAPEPAAMRGNRRRCLLRRREPRARAELRPMSTDGPSGPRDAPLPSVMAAGIALNTGASACRSCTCRR